MQVYAVIFTGSSLLPRQSGGDRWSFEVSFLPHVLIHSHFFDTSLHSTSSVGLGDKYMGAVSFVWMLKPWRHSSNCNRFSLREKNPRHIIWETKQCDNESACSLQLRKLNGTQPSLIWLFTPVLLLLRRRQSSFHVEKLLFFAENVKYFSALPLPLKRGFLLSDRIMEFGTGSFHPVYFRCTKKTKKQKNKTHIFFYQYLLTADRSGFDMVITG